MSNGFAQTADETSKQTDVCDGREFNLEGSREDRDGDKVISGMTRRDCATRLILARLEFFDILYELISTSLTIFSQ